MDWVHPKTAKTVSSTTCALVGAGSLRPRGTNERWAVSRSLVGALFLGWIPELGGARSFCSDGDGFSGSLFFGSVSPLLASSNNLRTFVLGACSTECQKIPSTISSLLCTSPYAEEFRVCKLRFLELRRLGSWATQTRSRHGEKFCWWAWSPTLSLSSCLWNAWSFSSALCLSSYVH